MKKSNTPIYRCAMCGMVGRLPTIFKFKFKQRKLKPEDYLCLECQRKLEKQFSEKFKKIDQIVI